MAIRYFFSGASGIRASVLPEVAAVLQHRLLSMHETFKGNTKVWCEISHNKDCALKEIMLDSGAFTAFTKGKKVHLDDLIRIYDDTMRRINPKIKIWLINLDVIPGSPGKVAEPKEIQAALDESDKNYKILKKKYGPIVLPVYHQTESIDRLKEVASMNDYIGMGFRMDFAEKYRVKHAEDSLAFAHSLKLKVHGLATTGYSMLSRTNFDSVDSASWLYAAAMGKVLVISEKRTIMVLPISAQSPLQKDLRGHYNSLTPEEQQYCLKRFKAGKCTLEQLQNDLSYRILFTAKELTEWLQEKKVSKIRSDGSLFGL